MDAWRGTLFLPSRADTPETAIGLADQIDVFETVCAAIMPEDNCVIDLM